MQDLEEKIKSINTYVNQCLWMDFSYEIMNDVYIKIIGSLDLSWENYHSIELLFERPTNILTILQDWHKHDDKPFIELANKEEAIHKLGCICEEDYVFKINADGYSVAPIWISARSLKYSILK